jgi:hypothetical protein
MEKKTSKAFGKKVWLLGKDADGINYWLEEPSWDCGWYWGFGYVENYQNNRAPEKARDISCHQHFDGLFLKGPSCGRDVFKKILVETPLSDDEIWELCDYMRTYYTLREVAELFKHGYSYYTERAKIDQLQNEEQYDLVNKVWLPEVFKRIQNIFEKE